jgi:hypothetical protein
VVNFGLYGWINMLKMTKKVFNADGSWTAPAGVTQVIVYAMGGGAGGSRGSVGTAPTAGNGQAGGLGNHLQMAVLTVTPNTSYTITVGDGGAGATANDTAGTAGEDTTFGGLFTWKGAPVYLAINSPERLGVFGVVSILGDTGYAGGADMWSSGAAPGGGSDQNLDESTSGYCGYIGKNAARGSGGIGATIGGNGGSGMSGEGIGGTGGSGAAAAIGGAGGNAGANTGAGGGGGAGGGSTTKASGNGGNGGSGQLVIMWVE